MHKPVLLKEAIEYLNPKPGQKFIDATVDGGGHAMAILEKIVPNGKLLGIEWDGELLKYLKFKIENLKLRQNVILAQDSYINLKKIAIENGFMDADGILFDLGMSSWHLEEAGKGFTFQKNEPLDMRYGVEKFPISPTSPKQPFRLRRPGNHQFPNVGLTAEEIINKYSYDELAKILKEYGEERFAKSIAAHIVKARKEKPIKTTYELVEIIKHSAPFWYRQGRIHYATRTFQALRIAVNDELENLKSGLGQAMDILTTGGRIAVMSFHSLEDRIVKNFFRTKAKEGVLKIIIKKPIIAGLAEITENPRARSAKLRVAEKIVARSMDYG